MRDRDGERRQEHRPDVAGEAGAVPADGEEAAHVERERQEEHDPDPEGRKPQADQRDDPHDLVAGRVALARRDRRQRQGDQDREAGPVADEPERDRQPVEDELTGRHAVVERVAQVAMDEPLHELHVLDRQRLVEAPLLVQERDPLRRRLHAQHRAGRVARHEMDHEEHEDGDAQHDRHHLEQPARDECGLRSTRYRSGSVRAGYFESQTSSMW